MHNPATPQWDQLDGQILKLLRQNGRMPLADIALQLGVAMSTVSNRIKRLTEAGVVQGYRLVVDPRFSVAGVEALVTLTTPLAVDLERVVHELQESGVQVTEVYRTLGSAEYVCRVVAPSIDHLDRAIAIARRSENGHVDAVILSELLPSPELTPPTPGRPDVATQPALLPATDLRRLVPGSRLYFVSLTELDPERLAPAELVRKLAAAGYTTLVVDAVNPWGAYYPTRQAPLAPHCHGQDLLGAFCAAAEQQAVSILAAIECRALPPVLAAEHPRWLQRHPSGEASVAYGPFYRGCYRTGWQEWIRSVAKELLETYSLQGLVLLNPEYDPDGCYCETCQEGFRARRGVQPPAGNGRTDYPTSARWLDWKVESVSGLVASLARLVHAGAADRQLLVMSDQALAEKPQAYGLELSQLATVSDAVICAGEPKERSSAPLLETFNRWDRGAALTSPGAFAASLSASYAPWTHYPVPASCLQQAVAGLAAAGQTVACLDLGRFAPEEPVEVASQRYLLQPTRRPLWDYLALVYSEQDWYTEHGRNAMPSHAACFHGLYDALSRANLPFQVISLEQAAHDPAQLKALQAFRVIVLPGLNHLPLPLAEWLTDFVEQGGGVIATYPGVLADRQAQAAPVLQELLGVARATGPRQAEAAYVQMLSSAASHGADLLPAYPRWFALEPDRAQTWGWLLSQESAWGGMAQTRSPAILAHQKGKGRTVCFPFPLGALYRQFPDVALEQLLRSAAEWAAQQPAPLAVDAERPLLCRVSQLVPVQAAQGAEQHAGAAGPAASTDAARLAESARPAEPAGLTLARVPADAQSEQIPDAALAMVRAYVMDGDFAFARRPWRGVPPLPRGSITLQLPAPPQAAWWSADASPARSLASWERVGPHRYQFTLPSCRGAALLEISLSPTS
ncbi:MAG: winged helix-turn-helix transcriptional regulator [Limnochordaceae bacterium]|nr:winged helix-turn-helix transcriptional regulator [Limnochordaceae bacterium]